MLPGEPGRSAPSWPGRSTTSRNSAFSAIVVATIFPVYYAELVVGNREGLGDFWWGLAGSVSMGLVAVGSPVLGGIADHAGARKPFLVGFTLIAVAATALLATVGPGAVALGIRARW